MGINDILDFWFNELKPFDWWKKDKNLDLKIKLRFQDIHSSASSGELYEWRKTPQGALAEIIILDQFSRNIYRNTPNAFINDVVAVVLAQFAITNQFNMDLPPQQQSFLYMPFMHSESIVIHNTAESLFNKLGLDSTISFAKEHQTIIKKFGRYPHRNEILGRKSSLEEIEFLKTHSGF